MFSCFLCVKDQQQEVNRRGGARAQRFTVLAALVEDHSSVPETLIGGPQPFGTLAQGDLSHLQASIGSAFLCITPSHTQIQINIF